jgi:hypothetical protein
MVRREPSPGEEALNRIAALLIVLAAYGLLAVGASAKNVRSEEVAQSRGEVLSYWTAERMRDAKPVPVAKGGKPGGGGGSTKPGAATEVPFPYTGDTRTNGKVFFTDSGVNYVCSGTALTSGNESVVWTAGHCVHDGPGTFHTNWMFAPAYHNGNDTTLGRFAAAKLFTTDDWAATGDFGDDLGAAYVSPSGGTLTDRVGGRSPAFNDPQFNTRTYTSYGYPAQSPYNGQLLWSCNSPLYRSDTSVQPSTMGIQCSMNGGSSGGGWVSGGLVYSVNSYTYNSLKNVMFGPRQGAAALDLYTEAETYTP